VSARGLPSFALCVMIWLAVSPAARAAPGESTAFFYGSPVPRELFEVYDQVVLQPDQVPAPARFAAAPGQPVAYVSIGEVAANSAEARALAPGWVLGRNPGWGSLVLDPRNPGCRKHLLARIDVLWQRGYRRFFLDTLDSYRLGLHGDAEREQARQGLLALLREAAARHRGARWLLNRGFELLPDVAGLVQGVVVESLFDGWDPRAQRYVAVSEQDRSWLLEQLRSVRERYRLPITVIDYRPTSEREAARQTAAQIAQLGFEPWVTDHLLTSFGVGEREVLPRQVLILSDEPPGKSQSLRLLAPVLEHLGYVALRRSLGEGLPPGTAAAQFAGLVTWLSASPPPELGPWLVAQLRAGTHVAMFGTPAVAPASESARALGLQLSRGSSAEPTHVLRRDALIGFEADVPLRPFDGALWSLHAPGADVHLELADAAGHSGVAVATADWGGLAPSHALALRGLEGQRSWVIDPFAFLQRALQLPGVPQPDLTTENGRRVALSVIRAAGLAWPARLPGAPPTASALEQQILARHSALYTLDVAADGAGPAPSAEDLAAAESLLSPQPVPHSDGGGVALRRATASLRPGAAALRSERASITQLEPTAELTAHGLQLVGPIASDLRYLPARASEAYPYARVLETLELTERPRRLEPILLDYHAFLAGSPGGIATLGSLYRWVAEQEPYWLGLDAWRARVEAFRDQVVARHLDGSVSYLGGTALRTVRLPYALGSVDWQASRAVTVLRRAEQGQYVSFGPGAERRLAFAVSPAPGERPHLTETNGEVRSLTVRAAEGTLQIDFEIAGPLPLQLTFGGLGSGARCRVRWGFEGPGKEGSEGAADAAGTWRLSIARRETGPSRLECSTSGDRS
jgi:hypothetical protein